MVAWPLIGFLLHTIGWVIPLSLLFDAGMRFTRDGESPVGLRRIFLGGMLVLLALLFSILYLTVFLVPSIELHLISHSTILVGFILALSGARRALASFIHRETPGRKQTVARQPFFAIPTLLVLLVIAEGLVSRAEPVWLLDRALYALNLSLLAALYTSFGMLTKREAGSSVSTVLSVVAAASALLVIAAHSLMIMDVSPALKAIAQIGRGALLALGAVAVFIAYRLWLARPAGSPSADSVLLTPKLRLQQRLALFITVGTVLFAAGTVLMSTMTRSSIQTVEQTYIHNQERVAHAVARNFESLTADLATTLSRFAEHPAVQRIRIDSLRFLFSRQHLRWQQVVSSFSRVDEHGVLRYTYPEVVSSIGADLTFQEHVRHFLRTRQITLSGVFTAVQGFNAIALYVPVFTKGSSNDSVFAGGVALLMHTDAFSERVFRNVQYLNPNPVAAINLAGNIIASSDSGEVRSSAQEYLQAVYPVRIPDDTAASIVRRALELDTPSVLPLVVGEALAAQRWIISYPIHLQGTRLGSILLPIRQVDVVSFYRSSIAQQVAWWMVLTALLMFTMGSIVVVVYRWAVYLESEVKRTVALVREREERLQTIVDSEPECVEILDAEGCILEMNRAGLQMIEADSSAAVQGKSVYPLIVPEYREQFRQLTRGAFEERSGRLEFEIMGLRGTRRWLDTHMVPLRDAAGRVVAALGITRDITERKRAEDAFRASEQRYRQLVEISPDAIAVHCEGRIVFVNPAAVQLLGARNADELLGKPALEFVHPDDRAIVRQRIAQMYETGRAVPVVEERFVRLDGSMIHVDVAAVPTTYDGKPAVLVVIRDITERKRAEKELRESEERFRTVTVQTGQLVYDYNPITGAIAWAGAIEQLTGFTDEEFQAFDIRRWEEHIHPDDRPQALQLLETAMNSGGEYRAEYRFRRKDHSYIVVEDNGVFLFEKDGKPYRMLGTMADITERKRAELLRFRLSQVFESIAGEQALPQILERLTRSVEEYIPNMKCSVLLLDAASKRLRHGAAPSLPDEYNAAIDGIQIGPRVGSCGTAAYEKRLVIVEDIRTDPLWEDFRELADKHGLRACWSQPIIDHEGAVLGTFALYYQQPRRPTEAELELINTAAHVAGIAIKRKRAEDALRASEQRYRELFEESKDAVYISTPEGRMIDINPAGVELFGYGSREELLKADIANELYADPSERARVVQLLEESGSVKDLELRLRKRTGEEMIVLETASVIRDATGRVRAFRGILRDVTLQRKLENEIRQAQKMESIGVLAGGIAHDFNNILGGILGYASYLKSKMADEHPFHKHLETIERSALRAADLTSKLLAFARGGRYEVKPVSLNSIVNETVGLLERSFDKIIAIEVLLDPTLPTVEADAGQLHQVLMNLCVNARDAMPGGGKLVIETTHALLDEEFAKTRVEARPGHFVILSVSDTGIGIDKQTLPRIFDPFFTTKEKGKGTGLGLSMVYGIVKAHNGFIRVYSEVGHGTTVRVYLPASDKPAEEAKQTAADIEGGTETVLVVDDEDFVRDLAVEVLGSAGYKVLAAADGEEALLLYQKQASAIDLVILDMIMPRMNGRETFSKLREVNPHVRVLLSTGYSQNGTAREILDQGAVGFLQKPYHAHELLKKVRAALHRERSHE